MKTDDQVAARARRDYVENRVLTADPLEIVEMLYHVAMDALATAITHLNAGDAMPRSRAVSRAQEAVNELALALDHSAGAPFSRTLAELYAYVQEQIIKGHTQQSEAAFQEALSILTTLSEGWSKAKESVASANQERGPEANHAPEESAEAEIKAKSTAYGATPSDPVTSRDWSC